MKKYIFLAGLLFLISYSKLSAQSQYRLDKNTIVIDSISGKVYAFEEWQKLNYTGHYMMKRISKAPTNAFYLVKFSDEEIVRLDSLALSKKPQESNSFTTNNEFRNFNEKDINGNKWNLKNLKGKIVVLYFWTINCSPCVREIAELNKVVENYKNDENIVFISFCLDYKSDIVDFLKTNPFNYKIIDDCNRLFQTYGVTTYPTRVVLDKEGIIKFHTTWFGRGTVPWLVKTIDSLKNN